MFLQWYVCDEDMTDLVEFNSMVGWYGLAFIGMKQYYIDHSCGDYYLRDYMDIIYL